MAQKLTETPPAVLAIAGFDPTCGAGVGADLKTIAACGAYGIAAITALTVQNTQRVASVVAIDSHILQDQILHILQDIPPQAVKIGMIFTRANVLALAELIHHHPLPNIILDPILKSSTGTSLLEENALEDFKRRLLPLADCVTPNIDEAALLSNQTIRNVDEMKSAAKRILDWGCKAIVVTGGHLPTATDVLFDGKAFQVLAGEKILTRPTHGTGCAFSSSLASYRAQGLSLEASVIRAKEYVTQAIQKAFPVGHGNIPLNHFFRFDPD